MNPLHAPPSTQGCSAGLSLLSHALAVLGCPSSAHLALLMVPLCCLDHPSTS